MRMRLCYPTILCIMLVLPMQAQVVANEKSVEKKQYSSPVVLDVNFNLAHQSLWDAGRVSPKQSLDAFVCDGIYVDDFGMEGKARGRGEKQELEVAIHFTLNAEARAPKRKATVMIQLFDGETAITQPVRGRTFTLKDGDSEKQKLEFKVPVSKLKTDPLTNLKLTLTVEK